MGKTEQDRKKIIRKFKNGELKSWEARAMLDDLEKDSRKMKRKGKKK